MLHVEGMEVDRGQLQGGLGESSIDIHDSSSSKLSEDAANGDLGANSVNQDDKGQASDPANSAAKFQSAMKPVLQAYRVACLNCGAQLHVELPHPSGSFQCCQCHAVHKIIQDSFAMSDQNKKRKRTKEKPTNGKPDDNEPRELSIYNKFIREHLAALKNDNPALAHKDAYKQVSAMWSSSPLNPKRMADGSDPSSMGAVGAPSAPVDGAPNAFHPYSQDAVHDHHAAAAAQERAREAAMRGGGLMGVDSGTEHAGTNGPEHPPLQPS